MIGIKMKSNLPLLIDYINTIPFDISQNLAKAIQSGSEQIRISMDDFFEDTDGYIDINLNFTGGEYQIIVDGVDEELIDDILDELEEIILTEMKNVFTQDGYLWQ